jgi:hypothetical protein
MIILRRIAFLVLALLFIVALWFWMWPLLTATGARWLAGRETGEFFDHGTDWTGPVWDAIKAVGRVP